MTYVEYKMLNPFQRFGYNFKKVLVSIPRAVGNFFKAIGRGFVKLFTGIGKGFKNYGTTFAKGDWATKLSYSLKVVPCARLWALQIISPPKA